MAELSDPHCLEKFAPLDKIVPITPPPPQTSQMGVDKGNPNSRGHTEAWVSLTPTKGATPKRRSP